MYSEKSVVRVRGIFKLTAMLVTMVLTILSGCGAEATIDSSLASQSAGTASVGITNPNGSIWADSIAFIGANRMNEPQLQVPPLVREKVKYLVENDGYITFFPPDGDCLQFEEGVYLGSSAISATRKKKELEKQVGEIENLIESKLIADTAETNLYKALDQASRSLALLDRQGVREIIIQDSGLSTAGYINFLNDTLNATPDDILTYLESQNALLNLSGIHITWVGLGGTCPPQDPLPMEQRRSLLNIWEAILAASGAESVSIMEGLEGAPTVGVKLPRVTPVPIERTSDFTHFDPDIGDIELGEDVIAFDADTPIYVDKDAAESALSSLVAILNEPANQNLKISIYGRNASVNLTRSSYSYLSQQRGEAVADSMIEFGFDPSRISCIKGLGNYNPWHIADFDPVSGKQTADAWRNRSVHIVIDGSETDVMLQEFFTQNGR